jgi:hypothetical protein
VSRARVWKNRVTIICPACRDIEKEIGYTDPADGGIAGEHEVPFIGDRAWSFDGNLDRPTLSPSLLRTCEYGGGSKLVCHSFVRNGQIQYLGDCTHRLAGQTVDLPEIHARES